MLEVKISGRPVDSVSHKIVRAVKTEGKNEKEQIDAAITTFEHEIMAGCEVNPVDLWLFCTALKILAEGLEKGMNNSQRRSYKKLLNNIGVTTIMRTTEGGDDET